jgi:hypothetical protein
MSIIVSSTTDDQAAVNAAAGIEAPPVEETPKDIAGKPPKPAPEPEIPEEDEEDDDALVPEEEEEGKPEPQPVKKLGGFQRKIAALERDKDYAFRRMIALEDQLRRTAPPQQQQQPQQQQRPANVEPQQSEFSDYDAYQNALIEYRVGQRFEQAQRQAQQQAQERAQQEQYQGWQQNVGRFRNEAPDFDEVLGAVDHIEIPPFLQQALIEDEMGPKLAYELAKNPEAFEKVLQNRSQFGALKALGEFKAGLNGAAKAPPPQRRPVSQAPEPIRPVSKGANGTVTRPLDEMAYQDYKRARERQIKAQRAG